MLMSLLACLLAFAGEIKAFTLRSGEVVRGEVVDEGATAYLVRQGDQVVRIAYNDIISVTTPGASSMAPVTQGSGAFVGHISREGFRFSSAEAMADYESKRLELQVLDLRSGSWHSQIATSVVGQGQVSSTQSGRSTESLAPQYRVATGEGVVLAVFDGHVLRDGAALFRYLNQYDAYVAHGKRVGAHPDLVAAAERRKRRALMVGVGGFALSVGGLVVGIKSDTKTELGVAAGMLFGGVTVGTIGAAVSNNTVVPRVQTWELTPWKLDEVMAYVRAWNTQLRSSLGVH